MNNASVTFRKSIFCSLRNFLHWAVILSFLINIASPTIQANASNEPRDEFTSDKYDVGYHSNVSATSPEENFHISDLTNNASTPSYYYATRVLETGFVGSPCSGFYGCHGTVTWSSTSNVIGIQDGLDAKVINSSHYLNGVGYRACMVVSLGQVVNLDNGAIEAFVHQPQITTQDMGMEIAVSSSEIPCDSSNWIIAARYQEVGSSQDANWYGRNYTGDVKAIRIEVWSNGGNASCSLREFFVDSVRVQGVPVALLDRSSLSNNQPKNGSGDPRECAVDGCANAVATAGDPIDTRTGNFDYSLVDLSIQTIAGSLALQRSYASQALTAGLYSAEMSPGWTHNQDIRLVIEGDTVWFKGHTLNQYRFSANLDGTYTPYPGVLANLTKNNQNTTAPEDDVYTLTGSDQSVYIFDYTRKLQSWRNELDYGFNYTYASNLLYRVTEPTSGRYLQFNYQSGRLASVNDPTSRQVIFGYDAFGDLTSFTDARGKTWTYEYDGTSHRLASVVEPSASAGEILRIVYDAQGRATEQFDGANQRIVKITFNTDGTSTIEDALGREATHSYDHRNTNTGRADTSGYTLQKTYDANFRPAQVIDQDNRTLQTTWSANGANLTHIKDAANYETSLQYDAGNHLTQVKDPLYNPAVPNNHVIDYAYTGTLLTGATRQTVEWGPITTSYTYTTTADAPQPVDLLKTITDALGHTTHLIYDAAGQLVSMQDAELNTTQFAYDTLGRVTDVTDPLGRVMHTQYDGAGNITKVIQNYDTSKAQNAQNLYNLTTEFFYDDQGRLYQTLDTLGAITTYTYDAAGRVYQVIDDNGKTSTSFYNAAGQLTSVSDPLGHNTGYEYDSAGRLWKVKDALNRVILTYAYNPDSTLLTETYPTPNGDYVVTYETYDALKRPTRVSDNAGHVSEVAYDAYGNPLTRTDALGRMTKYEYNDLGLLSAVVQNYKANPGSGDDPNATNARTEYTYDKTGNLKKIKDANGHETTYDYDVLNRLWKITDPLGHVTEFGYDALGNRTSLKDANNQTTIFNYDIANRLDIIDYPSGMADVDFGYDPLGRLTGMDDSLGHTTWAYDNLSRVTSITDPFNKTVGYGYDDDGKRTSITYPAPVNKTITYQYNTLDQLEHVLEGATHLADYTYDIAGRLSGGTLTNGVVTSMGYDLSGQITNLAYTKGTNQLAQYVYQYDPVGNREEVQETVYYPHFVFLPAIRNDGEGGQMQSLAEGAESSELDAAAEAIGGGYPAPGEETFLESPAEGIEPQDSEAPYPAPQEPGVSETSFFQKIWDFVARLFVDRTPTVSAHSDPQSGYPAPNTQPPVSPSNTPQTIHYEYDALNRLIGADYTTGQDYAFTYDKAGNRKSQTIGSATTIYQYDEADRLTNAGGVTFTWDNNGNLLNDGVNTYSYDFANRLAAVTGQGSSSSFGYDGLGNRYQQTANGQATTYTLDLAGDLSQVLYDGEFSYYYGLGRISQQKNGVSDYFLTDALGSVRQLTNQNGSVSFGQAFDPFGNSIGQSGQGGSSYGYAGEWEDPTGLVYLRARYYSTQGRFTTKDPFPGLLTQPASLTPYVYALNSPVLYSDPSGEFVPILAIAGLGFAAGAIINTYQQTNGFSSFCDFDIVEALAWGVGGAAAATSFSIMAVSGVGLIGMGMQGVALGLSSLGFSASLSTSVFIAGSTTWGWSSAAMTWLFTSQTMGGNNISQSTISKNLSRLPVREGNSGKTSGILVVGKNEIPLESGWNGPASRMPPQSRGFNIITRTHVEGHASALMQQNSWKSGTLYINNPPCTSCNSLLPRMLPPDSLLRIIGPGGYDNIFKGIQR